MCVDGENGLGQRGRLDVVGRPAGLGPPLVFACACGRRTLLRSEAPPSHFVRIFFFFLGGAVRRGYDDDDVGWGKEKGSRGGEKRHAYTQTLSRLQAKRQGTHAWL
jgi:hypothetical protein